jgi:hypothetical protein
MASENPAWREEFERGATLFNDGRFFECHEVWEIAWKQASGAEKILMQALIQSAAALLHLQRANHRGAESLWAKARAKFKAYPVELFDCDLVDFATAIDRHFAAIREGRLAGPPPLLRKLSC